MSRIIVTTTPLPLPMLREVVEHPRTLATGGSTLDNPYLSRAELEYARSIIHTELGRQEVLGEILSGIKGALWGEELIERQRLRDHDAPRSFDRVLVAIDPAVSKSTWSDYTGLVVLGRKGNAGYVLESKRGKWDPLEWAREAVELARHWESHQIVIEANQGGDALEAVVRQVDGGIGIKQVKVTRDKYTRATPVQALYESGRMWHVGAHPQLEGEQVVFTPESKRDDLVDALTMGVIELGLPEGAAGYDPFALQRALEERGL